jgi:hypothetical protein
MLNSPPRPIVLMPIFVRTCTASSWSSLFPGTTSLHLCVAAFVCVHSWRADSRSVVTTGLLDVLAEPSDALAVTCTRQHIISSSALHVLTLPHNHTAHEDLNRPDTLERHLALAGCLVEPKLSPELILRDCLGVIDLVSKNKEGGVCQRLHGEECVELGLGLGETLVVLGVNEEDNAADLGEVVAP